MGFMKKVAGPLLQGAASFIPGGSTLAKLGGAALGLGGSALGALGAGGKQGGSLQDLLDIINQTTKSTGTESSTNFQEALENPAFAAFREQLIPSVMGEIRKAGQPVYGEAQKAAFMNQLNDLAAASMQKLQSNLAGVGGLNSGRFGAGGANIELGKLGELSKFFSQLPVIEAQARSERMNPLLSLATGWAGRAPLSYKTTGDRTFDSTSEMTGESKRTGTTAMTGPSFGRSFASGLSDLAGTALADFWNQKRKATPTRPFTPPFIKPQQPAQIPMPPVF